MPDHTDSWGDRVSALLHPSIYADHPAPVDVRDALRQLRDLKATLRDIATEQRLRRAERLSQSVNPDTDPFYNEWYARSCKAYKGADRHRRAIECWLDAEEDGLALQSLERNTGEPTPAELRYLLRRTLDTLIRYAAESEHPKLRSELIAIRRVMHPYQRQQLRA